MADDRSRKLTDSGSFAATTPTMAGQQARDPRAPVVVPIRYRYESFIDFIETQSVNVSRSGVFVASKQPLPVGTIIDFEFALADGFPLLRGKAEVIRTSANPPGMGMRFQQLDEPSRKLIDRIIAINTQEGKQPTVPLDFEELKSPAASGIRGATGSSGVHFVGRDLRIEINPTTAGYFTNNPLLNIRLGGFVVPCDEDVSLGTMFSVVLEARGNLLWSGKGKVVAKHETRLGIRLADVARDVLTQLQAEIAKQAPGK